MTSAVEIGTLIDRDPAIRAGRPKIAGTGVTVMRVAAWYKMGLSPEEIATQYGHLAPAQVHAALAYYHAQSRGNRSRLERGRSVSRRGQQEEGGEATNVQILTIVIALGTSFLAVLTGVLLNNTRLNDVKELLRAEIRAAHAEMRADFGGLRVLMEKNHSETLARFAELDTRLTRLENERRIVQ
jgi:uncharacterized protein (DUF433 family)